MNKSNPFRLRVKGANACFTRPEMKVERVSYDVITPSAARGIFEAILWKPAIVWHILLRRTQHGFSVTMTGSNQMAAEYSGLHTKRTLVLLYTLSGLLCAIAGILMLARFNSVRVGHGEALLLVTVLACFLGGVDPFGGYGRVVPVVVSLVILQILSSGLNLIGASQHMATAVWGLFLIAVMVLRSDQVKMMLGYFRRN